MWLAVGLTLAVVLWLPPLYDELTNDPGNLSLLWQYFTSGEQTIGWRAAGDVLLQHLNPWRLATGELWGDRQSPVAGMPSGSIIPGAVVLGCWVLAAIASIRIGDRPLRRFHVVTGVTLLSAFISASRVVPPVWYWVVMFMWGITVVVLIAIGWTAAVLVGRQTARHERQRATSCASWCTRDRHRRDDRGLRRRDDRRPAPPGSSAVGIARSAGHADDRRAPRRRRRGRR